MVNERDQSIISALQYFKALDRNQIISMYFKEGKTPHTNTVTANRVLNRLVLHKLIKVDKSRRPYLYLDNNVNPKSQKLGHYQAIADIYIDLCKHGQVTEFQIDFRCGDKGTIEPDIFCVWKGIPFFIEVQRTRKTNKIINKKLDDYLKLKLSQSWRDFTQHYPYVWLISDSEYQSLDVPSDIRLIQSRTVEEIAKRIRS